MNLSDEMKRAREVCAMVSRLERIAFDIHKTRGEVPQRALLMAIAEVLVSMQREIDSLKPRPEE